MAYEIPILNNFNAGELTPLLAGRIDLAYYHNGSRSLLNFVPIKHGPALRRSGTRFIGEVKTSAAKCRVMGFEFNVEQAYIFELGNGYFRFYKDKGQIFAPDIGASIANGTFDTGITGWTDVSTAPASIAHDAANLRLNLVGAATGVARAQQSVATTTPNVEHILTIEVFGAAGDAAKINIGSSAGGGQFVNDKQLAVGTHLVPFTPTSSPFYLRIINEAAKTLSVDNIRLLDNEPLDLKAAYLTADLFQIRKTQSADVMYLANRAYDEFKLTRSSHTGWSMVKIAFVDGPYESENATATTLTPAATSGLGVTVTASATTGINADKGFLATDVGRLIRIKHSTTWGYARITSVTDTTHAVVDIKAAFAAITASAAWRLGAWSGTTGHPAAVAFHEERLGWFGHTSNPGAYGLSKAGDFENHTPGTLDDDAIYAVFASNQVNNTRWVISQDLLMVGTAGAVAKIDSSKLDGFITPANVEAKKVVVPGVADVASVEVSNGILFLARHARKLLSLTFDFNKGAKGGFSAPDVTQRAEHIARGGIVEMAYQQEPFSIVWCARADGTLLSFTYVPEEEVLGWARHTVGGADAAVESVATIPGNGYDELWLIVKRTINGQTKRYVEVLEEFFWRDDQAVRDAFFGDSGLTYDGAPTTTLVGLGHLEGQTVKILADGAPQADKIVIGGTIALDVAASKVQVGLGSTYELIPTRIEAGASLGTAQGQLKNIPEATIRFHRSGGVKFGRTNGALDTIDFRDVTDPMDAAVPLFSGDKVVDLRSDWETAGDLIVTGNSMLPCCVVAIVPKVMTGER